MGRNDNSRQKPGGDADRHETDHEEEYRFLQERIKETPVDGKKLIRRGFYTAGAGLIFGLCACVAFFALKPWAEANFSNNTQKVVLPKDSASDEEDPATEGEEESKVQTLPELTIDNYKELNKTVYNIAKEAEKSIVEVKAVYKSSEWLEEDMQNNSRRSGVVVADNGKEILILTDASVLEGADGVTAILPDGNKYQASVKKRSRTLDVAVLSVAKSSLKENVWNVMKVAVLGNSNLITKGDTILALGMPSGYSDGLQYGMVSTLMNYSTYQDGSYRLINTDITGSENGTGVLVNLSGEIVGLIDQTIAKQSGNPYQLGAVAISGIKDQLELMLNGQSVPYIGILGSDVTEEVKESQNIPQGVYVKEVAPDSPAMRAGIQNGDVVVAIGGTEVKSLNGYHSKLMECTSGEHVEVTGKRAGAEGYIDIVFDVVIGTNE